MIFPVSASVITPTYRPQNWGLAEGEITVQQASKQMEKDVKDIAIKAAAAQMALQIGLMFIPVVGWALGAIVALVQFFVGKHYDNKVKRTIEDTKVQIEAKANAEEAKVKAAMNQVYTEEYRGAVALAMSNMPLDGLGDFWSDTRDSAKKAVKKAAPIVRKIAMAPVTAVVAVSRKTTSAVLKGAAEVSKAAGADGFARDIRKFEEKGDAIAKDIQYRTEDPKRAAELLSGKETANVAAARAAELKAVAFKEIDRLTAEAIAQIYSPEGRLTLRMETARALRGDPETLGRAAQFEQEQQMLRAQLAADNTAANAALASMIPTAQTTQTVTRINSTAAILGAALAAGAAFLAFR